MRRKIPEVAGKSGAFHHLAPLLLLPNQSRAAPNYENGRRKKEKSRDVASKGFLPFSLF